MFGNLHLGYWLLLSFAAAEIGAATLFGIAPASSLLRTGELLKTLPIWLSPSLIWFAAVASAVRRRKTSRPFTAIRRLVFWNRFWLLRGIMFMGLIFPLRWAINSLKAAIPNIRPFYADPVLSNLDRAIFGTDAWRITHAFIGPMGTVIIDRVYMLWFFVMMFLLGWLIFTRNMKLQLRGLLSYVLTWILLGNFAAAGLSSVGPCFYADFYDDNRYLPLMEKLRAYDETYALAAIRTMRYLLDNLGKDSFGSGISAMPSLHVAIAFLCFLVCLNGTKRLWPKLLAGAFATAILVGSVHLGWHYAVDGIASLICVTIIWVLAGRLVDWADRRSGDLGLAPMPQAALLPT